MRVDAESSLHQQWDAKIHAPMGPRHVSNEVELQLIPDH